MLLQRVIFATLLAFVAIASPVASNKLLNNPEPAWKADGGGPPPGWLIPPASTKALDADQPAFRADGGGPPPGWLIPEKANG